MRLCWIMGLLLLAGSALAAEQPLDGTFRPVASSPETVWFYQNTPVKVAKTEYKGFGFLKDTKGGQADGWVEFDVRGWDRFTAQIGLSDAWPAWQQDGSIIFYVDGQQAGAYMHKRGQTAQAIDIPLTGKSRLKIEMKIFVLLAAPTLQKVNPATLDIATTPPGASITVDGQATGQVTPCRVEVNMRGQQTREVEVTASMHGYRTTSTKQRVTPGVVAPCTLALPLLPAMLIVNSQPPGARVTVDGKPLDQTTPCRVEVDTQGQRTRDVAVTAQLDGYRPALATQTVTAGGATTSVLILTPLLTTLSITSTPPGAAIALEGVATRKTTPCQLEIDMQKKLAREVTVAVMLDGYRAAVEKYTVTAGGTTDCKVTLEKLPISPGTRPSEERINPKDGTTAVWIPAGEFTLGNDRGDGDERPQRRVSLDGYWISKHEVTVGQFRKFCQETRNTMPVQPAGSSDKHPVVNVTWGEAYAYARWAGGCLPTEAEWEKAARGTDGRRYPWGNDWDARKCNTLDNNLRRTMQVGSYPAGSSPYGVLDMAGNVYEWCQDWYQATYYTIASAKNPQGPEAPPSAEKNYSLPPSRAIRGGSWMTNGVKAYAANRKPGQENKRYPDCGFRIVLLLPVTTQ